MQDTAAKAGSQHPLEKNVESSSGPSSHVKKANKKKVAQSPNGVLKMKTKIDATGDALHQQYVMNRYQIRRPKKAKFCEFTHLFSFWSSYF